MNKLRVHYITRNYDCKSSNLLTRNLSLIYRHTQTPEIARTSLDLRACLVDGHEIPVLAEVLELALQLLENLALAVDVLSCCFHHLAPTSISCNRGTWVLL